MKFKRILGLSLVGVSILSSLSRLTVTGAVVGTTQAPFLWTALVCFIIGFFLLLEREPDSGQLEKLLTRVSSEHVDTLILDSSAVIQGRDYILDLVKNFQGTVYAPPSVIEELKGNIGGYYIGRIFVPKKESSITKEILTNPSWIAKVKSLPYTNDEEKGFYRGELKDATKYLVQTEKHRAWKELTPLYNGKITDPATAAKIRKKWEHIIPNVEKGAREHGMKPVAYLKKHYRISKGDLQVMAHGLFLARYNEDNDLGRVGIVANDRDLEEACSIGYKSNAGLRGQLLYLKVENQALKAA